MEINKNSYIRNNNPKSLPTYNNMAKVKAAGVTEQFSVWEYEEFIKCKKDPKYFIENYIILKGEGGSEKFKLYDYQRDSLDIITEKRYSIILAPRRAGKSICILGYILWFALFHSNKIVYVLSKTYDDSKELLGKLKSMFESLPFFLQPGVVNYAVEKVELYNGSKIKTASSKGVRGDDSDLLYADEFSYLPNSKSFWQATYPLVAKRKNAKIIITSTPDGQGNEFYNQWENAVRGISHFVPIRWYWDKVPGYDEKFKEETISNIGEEAWRTEFECQFLATSNTLIDGQVLMRLESMEPIKIYDKYTNVYHAPQKDHKYVLTCDVADGVGKDYTVMTIIDITNKPYEIAAVYRNNKLSPFALDTLIVSWAKRYNNAFVVIETNSRGADVSRRVIYDHDYENVYITDPNKPSGLGIDMKKGIKNKGCITLKDLIETDMITINDHQTIRELKTFQRNKLGGFEGINGINDDTVMSLVLFSILTNDYIFVDLQGSDKDINETLSAIRSTELPQEFLLAGFTTSQSDPFNDINKMDNYFINNNNIRDDYQYDDFIYYNNTWDY